MPRLVSMLLLAVCGAWLMPPAVGDVAAGEVDRSPVDLVLSPNGSWLVTANQTSHTLSLVRTIDGKILDEVFAGRHPVALSLTPDARQLVATARDAGEVRIFRITQSRLIEEAAVATGGHPWDVAITADGLRAYVALAAADQVAVIDLAKHQIVARIDIGREPRYVALSPDGARLAVSVVGERGVALVDTTTRQVLNTQRFVGLNPGHFAVSRDGRYAYFPWMTYRANPITPGNIRLGWVLASRLGRLSLTQADARREALSLDPPGKAVADPYGIALTSDEKHIVISSSGTHELLVFKNEDLPFQDRGSTDHLEKDLQNDSERFFRIDVGRRPMGLQIGPDDRTLYVASYFDNCVNVVDLRERKLVKSIPLGEAESPSLARQGEAIFYDARRSLDQWYSCASCHDGGGSNAVAMDTHNDGTTFTFKTVTPLWNIHETGPWTWHGWQTDLHAAMRKSLTSTMLGPEPSDDDVEAVLAYCKTLKPPANPHRQRDGSLGEAARRGKLVFESAAAGCATCHNGPHFTDGEIHDVGLGSRGDAYQGFNTPSLIGVYHKTKLLHDGRAETLAALLTGDHSPEKVAGERKLTDAELADLIAYLKSL